MAIQMTKDKTKTRDVSKELAAWAEHMRKLGRKRADPVEDDERYSSKLARRMFGAARPTRVITDADRKSTRLACALAQIKANLR